MIRIRLYRHLLAFMATIQDRATKDTVIAPIFRELEAAINIDRDLVKHMPKPLSIESQYLSNKVKRCYVAVKDAFKNFPDIVFPDI